MRLLAKMAKSVKLCRVPVAIGADWQMETAVVGASGYLKEFDLIHDEIGGGLWDPAYPRG